MPDDPAWPDGLGPAFRAAIRVAERRGWMTYAALDAVLPERDSTSREIESVLADLRRRGIELVEDES